LYSQAQLLPAKLRGRNQCFTWNRLLD